MNFQETMKQLKKDKSYQEKISKVALQHYNAINSDKWHRKMVGVYNG